MRSFRAHPQAISLIIKKVNIMYYEINVSKKGKGHLFATAERSITSTNEFKKVYPIIREKFPESEGFELNVSYWSASGRQFNEMDIADLLAGR